MDTQNTIKERFPLGQVVATGGALALLEHAAVNAADLLARHGAGDWGLLSEDDRAANSTAIRAGLRIMSQYEIGGEQIWVITEADRSVTTLLLPEEY
jgi:hypothetical protein